MDNQVMLQAFEWQTVADGTHYKTLLKAIPKLKEYGVGAVWLPPAAKGTSDMDVGYSSYDLWDLGEFDQKGTVRTKYGTKEELKELIDALHEAGIQVLADMVLNHKGGADFSETFEAVQVDPEDRTKEISEPHEIEGWTGFDFPGRNKKYSDFVWNHTHFSGVDYDQKTDTAGIFKILGEGKDWSHETDLEKGNFDYLMNADIDHDNRYVRDELHKVCFWMIREMGYDGFRYDALKHISRSFIHELSTIIYENYPDFYFVGEYWQGAADTLNYYLEETDYGIDMFDVPLHFNFKEAGLHGEYDLRTLFDQTLVSHHPMQAVTFVDNHDSQPGQSLESWVNPDFKEAAYALILLRRDGYPCVFWADLVGILGLDYEGVGDELKLLLELRKKYAYGEQQDFFMEPQFIGWLREGNEEHPEKLLVLYARSEDKTFTHNFGEDLAGTTWHEAHGTAEPVTLNEHGEGSFNVAAGTLGYWILKQD